MNQYLYRRRFLMTREKGTNEKVFVLDEIKNADCREGILKFDQMISRFISEMNKFLPAEYQLDEKDRFFEIEMTYDEKGYYDGFKRCPCNRYDIIWAYKMFPTPNFE